MNTNAQETQQLLQRYREAAAGGGERNPEEANRWHDIAHACYRTLRESEAGRQGITALISDDDPYVRCCAAAHSLHWAPGIARPALEALRDSHRESAFDARMVLQEFDKGRLSFEF